MWEGSIVLRVRFGRIFGATIHIPQALTTTGLLRARAMPDTTLVAISAKTVIPARTKTQKAHSLAQHVQPEVHSPGMQEPMCLCVSVMWGMN